MTSPTLLESIEEALHVLDEEPLAIPPLLVPFVDELFAMDQRRLVPVNVDVGRAALLVVGATPRLKQLRPAMVEWFGEEMAAFLDRLEPLAWGAFQAETDHRAYPEVPDFQPLFDVGARLRALLVADIDGLVARGHVRRRAVPRLRGGSGFVNLAWDVALLATFLQEDWERFESDSSHTLAELAGAMALADGLILAASKTKWPSVRPSADVRQRALTLLSETYDEVRRMVTFLRWKERDVDRLVPSWHRGRPRRRKRDAGDGP
jgi:hypothetical protein